jgi:hypothetical protein
MPKRCEVRLSIPGSPGIDLKRVSAFVGQLALGRSCTDYQAIHVEIVARRTLPSNGFIEQCSETCPALLEFVGLVSTRPPLNAARAEEERAQKLRAPPDLDFE